MALYQDPNFQTSQWEKGSQGTSLQMKQVDNQIKSIGLQPGNVGNSDAYNSLLIDLQDLYTQTYSAKDRATIKAKILEIQGKMNTSLKDDTVDLQGQYNDAKTSIIQKYHGNIPMMIAYLGSVATNAYNDIQGKVYDLMDSTGSSSVPGKYSTLLETMRQDKIMYNDIASAYKTDSNTGQVTVDPAAADRLNSYGIFYKTDSQGHVTDINLKRVDLSKSGTAGVSDLGKRIQGVDDNGLGVYIDSPVVQVSKGGGPSTPPDITYKAALGGMILTKSAASNSASDPYTVESGTYNSGDLNLYDVGPDLVKNVSTNQVYKLLDDGQYHLVSPQTFKDMGYDSNSVVSRNDLFYQNNIAGNLGVPVDKYIQDKTLRASIAKSQSASLDARKAQGNWFTQTGANIQGAIQSGFGLFGGGGKTNQPATPQETSNQGFDTGAGKYNPKVVNKEGNQIFNVSVKPQ